MMIVSVVFALIGILASTEAEVWTCFSCSKLTWDNSGRCYPSVVGRTAEDGSLSMNKWGGTRSVDVQECATGRCYVEKDSIGRYHRDCVDGQPLYRRRSARCHTITDPDKDWGGDTVMCVCDNNDMWTAMGRGWGWMNRCNWDTWEDPYDCQASCTGGCKWSGEGNCDGGCTTGNTYDNVKRRCYPDSCNVAIGGDCSATGDSCCFGICDMENNCCLNVHTFCDGDAECCSGNCVQMGLWDDPDSTGRAYWSECRPVGYTWSVVDGNTGK